MLIEFSSLCETAILSSLCETAVIGPTQPLDAFAKLRRATVGFVVYVRPYGKTRPPPNGFS